MYSRLNQFIFSWVSRKLLWEILLLEQLISDHGLLSLFEFKRKASKNSFGKEYLGRIKILYDSLYYMLVRKHCILSPFYLRFYSFKSSRNPDECTVNIDLEIFVSITVLLKIVLPQNDFNSRQTLLIDYCY